MDGRESWRESVVRDPKGWWIDRRRSVTRYSCQQAAGIAPYLLCALPFPLLSYPVCHPRPTNFLARSHSRSTDARLPRNILHVNAASMFSQRRGLSMALSAPSPFPSSHPLLSSLILPARTRPSCSSFLAPSAFYSAILEYCSCYTVAGSDRGQLLDIPRERQSWCIDLELRWRRDRGTAESRPMSAEN